MDDDPETRWATSDQTKQAWLEVELAPPSTISRLVIQELDPRLTQYQLQYRLTRLFHTLERRVRARGLQQGCALVGRVPSRGAVLAFPSACELSRLTTNEEWKAAYAGTKAGPRFTTTFPAVQARFVRLNILDSSQAPTLWEFQVFAK